MSRALQPWRAWQAYWFPRAPALDLAIFRIAVIAFQMGHMLSGMAAHEFFRERAVLPPGTYDPQIVLRVLTLPLGWNGVRSVVAGDWLFQPGVELMEVVFWITLAAGIPALLGLLTNLSVAMFAVGSLFIQAYIYSFRELHHPEAVLNIALVLLVLSPCGRVLSIDALLRRWARPDARVGAYSSVQETSAFARWPLLLVQWLLALAYASAAYFKLAKSGWKWVNGYTLQHYLIRDGLARGAALGVWLGSQHELAMVMSWMTVAFEALFFLSVLSWRAAALFVPIGIALHAGIYATIRAPFFEFVVLYAAFVPWSVIARRAARACGLVELSGSAAPRTVPDGDQQPGH